jgi:hypothetical protein
VLDEIFAADNADDAEVLSQTATLGSSNAGDMRQSPSGKRSAHQSGFKSPNSLSSQSSKTARIGYESANNSDTWNRTSSSTASGCDIDYWEGPITEKKSLLLSIFPRDQLVAHVFNKFREIKGPHPDGRFLSLSELFDESVVLASKLIVLEKEIISKEKNIEELNSEINGKIAKLQQLMIAREESLKEAELNITNLNSDKQNLMAALKQTKDSLSEKETSLADVNKQIVDGYEKLAETEKILTNTEKKLADCEAYCGKLKFSNDENQREIEAMEMKISELEKTSLESNINTKATIKTLKDSIAAFKSENMDLKLESESKSSKIIGLEQDLIRLKT